MSDSQSSESPRLSLRSRVKELAKRFALTGATLLLLVICGEIAVRLFTNTSPPLLTGDPILGRRYVRSFEGTVYNPEVKREVHLRFDRHGFRGPDRPYEKPANVRRVAVLGDSMTASVSVEEADTWVCQLEKMLNESHPETTWEVLNFGVSGSSIGQELVVYRELASRYDPDIVLCAFYVGNDLTDNCHRFSNKPRIYFDLDDEGRLYQLPFSTERAKASGWLNRHSRLYVWQKVMFGRARHGIRDQTGGIDPGTWVHCREESDDLAYAWRLAGGVVEEMSREAERRGSRFGLVMIPAATQIYEDYFRKVVENVGELRKEFDPDYPDERMLALCGEANVPILQMTADFRKIAPASSTKVREQWLFNNGTDHLNVQGHTVAARSVHRFLTQAEPIETAHAPFIDRKR